MPCPACGKDPPGTAWKPDPLRWDLDPPCFRQEWEYVAALPGAPDYVVENDFSLHMNNVCRGCYSERLNIAVKIREKIRERGGLEELNPTKQIRQEYEAAHAFDKRVGRPAKIHSMQSEAGKALNGKLGRLKEKDKESMRWTVELLDGTLKAIREDNLECSKAIDDEHDMEKAKMMRNGYSQESMQPPEAKRPLGSQTTWQKVKGLHPGAVVRLKGLTGATELNGRKGRCISFDPEAGRWKIDLGDGYKNIKQDNLTPAPNEKPPTKASAEADKADLNFEENRRSKLTEQERAAEDYGWDG